jgi:hypothetical protein
MVVQYSDNTPDSYYGNRTVYGVENEALRYTWATYFLFIVTSSLIGDTTILIATMKYRAFKLHKVIVTIIQHIAFCDLMVSVTDVLPKLFSTAANGWVLGGFLCNLTSYTSYYFNVVSFLLICTMTTSKLFLLKYPLRSGLMTVKKAHKLCGTCWSLTFTIPVTFLLVDGADIYFSYRSYQCAHSFTSDTWRWFLPFLVILFALFPTCLVIASTICLLITARQVARRGRESLKRQGIITTILVATVYSISFLPYFVYRIGEYALKVDDTSTSFFHTRYFALANSIISLNTVCNFYIYSLTVHSFRSFLSSRMRLFYQFFAHTGIRKCLP